MNEITYLNFQAKPWPVMLTQPTRNVHQKRMNTLTANQLQWRLKPRWYQRISLWMWSSFLTKFYLIKTVVKYTQELNINCCTLVDWLSGIYETVQITCSVCWLGIGTVLCTTFCRIPAGMWTQTLHSNNIILCYILTEWVRPFSGTYQKSMCIIL